MFITSTSTSPSLSKSPNAAPRLECSAVAVPLAAVMNVVGVLGDLTESALKRSVGKKDTAQILPGHGGILDRIDSLLFNAPLIYYFALWYFTRS